MGDVHTFLPRLTLNELFVQDLMVADPPCFALGYVEERGVKSGFLAMRPDKTIPSASSEQGFRFGHAALGLGTIVSLPHDRTGTSVVPDRFANATTYVAPDVPVTGPTPHHRQ